MKSKEELEESRNPIDKVLLLIGLYPTCPQCGYAYAHVHCNGVHYGDVVELAWDGREAKELRCSIAGEWAFRRRKTR